MYGAQSSRTLVIDFVEQYTRTLWLLEGPDATAQEVTMSITNEAPLDDDHISKMMYLTSLQVFPMVMRAVVELKVLEIIAKAGPSAQLSPTQIASQLPTQNPEKTPMMLDRMLRLLASYSVLTYSTATNQDGQVERLYGLTPFCQIYLQDKDGASMCPMLLMATHSVSWQTWYHLADSVLDGGMAFEKAHNVKFYQHPDKKFIGLFNKSMSDYSFIMMKKVMEIYKGFEGVKELVDVGGGIGTALSIITSKYPSIKGINYDLPHVVEQAPSYPGITHVGGDIFASVPKAETIFMKLILHNWGDEQCLKLLKNCYEALPDHGKVICVEMIAPSSIDSTGSTKQFFQLDVIMMTQYHGGKERTEQDFENIAKEAGFASLKRMCSSIDNWVMEFIK
ncbi:hypothetical protein IFM89_037098 [Coptis chinensis]|uniref:Uncharacterized protein n=1 Tax=Coptis chinensis TaxID=261450 RepID=A0A835HQF9_9MAGN|nr:hypothetical protein IFM89_037098 [Coptis chinensis]